MVLLALLLGISSLLCRTILEENLNFREDFQQKIAFAHWPRIILFWSLGAGASLDTPIVGVVIVTTVSRQQ